MTGLRQAEMPCHHAMCSTCPRTAEGKATSTFNGMRHGPLSCSVLLPPGMGERGGGQPSPACPGAALSCPTGGPHPAPPVTAVTGIQH